MLISHTFSHISSPKQVITPTGFWKSTRFVENCLFWTPKHAVRAHLLISKNNLFTVFSWSRLLTTLYLSGPRVFLHLNNDNSYALHFPYLKNYFWQTDSWFLFSGGITLFNTEERKLSNLDNVYITHGITGYTQTIDLLCKSANIVSVPHSDRIKLRSWIANQPIW